MVSLFHFFQYMLSIYGQRLASVLEIMITHKSFTQESDKYLYFSILIQNMLSLLHVSFSDLHLVKRLYLKWCN